MRLLKLVVLCVVAGVVIAVGTAIGCLLALVRLDPAAHHSIHMASDLWPTYRENWPADAPDSAQVLSSAGIGFTGFEIRWNGGDAADPRMSRSFVTSIGWPQPILSTESDSIGRHVAVDLPGWTLADGVDDRSAANLPPRTVINWPGVLFNTASYGLTLLAIAVWISRSERLIGTTPRWMITVAAAAWAMALILPEWKLVAAGASGPGYPALVRSATYSKPEELSLEVNALFRPAAGSQERFQGFEASNIAVTWRCQSLLRLSTDGASASVLRRGEVVTAGWPMSSFIAGDSATQLVAVGDLSQLRVRWLSWLLNVAVFAAMLATLFSPYAIRRQLRWARGKCLRCGYPLGGRAMCPECGQPSGRSASG